MRPFAGSYFTGDGAIRDKDGYLWITGRVDGESLFAAAPEVLRRLIIIARSIC